MVIRNPMVDATTGAERCENQKHTTTMKLIIGNLSFDTTTQDLRTAFEGRGHRDRRHRHAGQDERPLAWLRLVTMGSSEEGQEAIRQFNGKPLDGRNLTVNVSASPRRNSLPAAWRRRRSQGLAAAGRKTTAIAVVVAATATTAVPRTATKRVGPIAVSIQDAPPSSRGVLF